MNDERYYRCHINITDRNTVWLEKFGPDGVSMGKRSGVFRYKRKTKTEIQNLCKAAQERTLSESEPKRLGELLYKALFDEKLQCELFCLYQQLEAEKGVPQETSLRIELEVDEQRMPDVAALPWEFLRKPPEPYGKSMWISTHPDLCFSRWRAHSSTVRPIELAEHERLRIAVVVSTPENLGEVVYENVWNSLQGLANEQQNLFELLPLVEDATRAKIGVMLERKPHILHFIGHARLQIQNEQEQDVGQVALVDNITHEARWVGAELFGELFHQHAPGVMLLHACEGAASSESNAFVGVASQIIQHNVSVVVAMQYEVTNAMAQWFALEFYKRLAMGKPVDKAVQEGRRSISLETWGEYKTRDFATPVLFMRVRDGHLFKRTQTDAKQGI